MGLFPSFQAKASWGPSDDRWYNHGGSFYGGIVPTSSGVSVSSDTAMRMMTVYNCVKVLYNCVSQMPLHVMQEVDGVKSKAKDDYRYRLLGKRPNSWMTAPNFWGLVVVHVSLRGNFYAFKARLENRPIKALIPIEPDRVVKVEHNDDFSITYHIKTAGGGIKEYPQSKIMHIRGMATNGLVGLNPIEYARESIGLGLASEKFLSRYFGKGVHPSAVVTSPDRHDPKTHANMRTVMKEKYEGMGSEQNQGFMFLDENMDIKFPPIKLVDAQFLELGKFNEAQICGMFGVPLMLVQAGDNPTTFASATEFKRAFVDLTLAPLAVNFESAVDRDCFSDQEQDRFYTKFNMGALYRGNITERFAAYQVGINTEFMCPDEARSLEDMNPIPDGSGKEYRTRTSTIKESDKIKQDPKKGEE